MLKIGIVGATGLRASAFKTGIESCGRAKITAICDLSQEKVDALARDWGVKGYTDYTTMLDDAKPDAVIVSTPVFAHVEQSVAALRRGIHVYSEIPAAAAMEDCKKHKRLLPAVFRGKQLCLRPCGGKRLHIVNQMHPARV